MARARDLDVWDWRELGTRSALLGVLDRVLPAHVHLVAVAVLSRPPRRGLGWLVPLALWLLECAGVVLVRRESR